MFLNLKSVRVVSGSWPPEICGVGDYMANVAKSLSKTTGVQVIRATLKGHSVATAILILVVSHVRRDELVYISYPTEGYGKSLLPFLLALGSRQRVVLHVHEYGSKNRYCRFLLRLFRRMNKVFFSNASDFHRYLLDCGIAADSPHAANWFVIPSPSNIPVTATMGRRNFERVKVIHFGQIRPNKGLEEIFSALNAVDGHKIDRLLIGGVPIGYEDYAQNIADQFRSAGVHVRLNLTAEQISCELAGAHVGVFAFPDGADERRGSLIAAMAHGVLCVTTHSSRTPQDIKDATVGVQLSSDETLPMALQNAIANLQSEKSRRIVERARELGAKSSFNFIASMLVGFGGTRRGENVE
jgi:glycosyltransferase involved in cell wall biosynthesis